MRWLRTALSLRAKITATFTLIVVGGTVVSTLIGSRIITSALLNQARIRSRQGLAAAQILYSDRLAAVERHVTAASELETLRLAIRSGSRADLVSVLTSVRDDVALAFVGLVEAGTGEVVRADGGAASIQVPAALAGPVGRALRGEVASSTEVLDRGALAAEHPELAARAVVPSWPAEGEGSTRAPLTSGLVLVSAIPVRSNGVIVGALYGGELLNNQPAIVDRVDQLLYSGERDRGRQIGTVSVLLGRTWVATNVIRDARGARATGVALSPDIAEPVLGRGESWSGRAFAVGDWYVAACAPLRNSSNAVVGALYVAILEAPFLEARTEIMLTFLVVCLVGLLVVFGLTYLLTRTMIHPLEEMVAATKRIAAGDLDATVNVASRDEIGELAGSFNNMLASLKTMNEELQQWARTLEEKVRDRTAELVEVQARMAQSEKLASIGRLAAGVAHGINNPLGGILSLTMLALEDLGPDHPLRGDLETIVKQTLRCREIVKGLLDFSRQSDTRATATDVNTVIENTLALLERQAIFHNIRIERCLEHPLPPVLIDPGQLQEVIINLVLNAVDAMEESGVLTVETRADERVGEVLIRIGDTGKGIAPEDMPFIFEPFFTTKKVGQGTGLGLAIVHGVVTRAGGKVEVTSHPGITTFTLRFPVTREAGARAAADTTGGGARQPAGR